MQIVIILSFFFHTEAPTSTTAAMATSDKAEITTATSAPPCSSLTSSIPKGSSELAITKSRHSGQNQNVSMTVVIGIICAAGAVLVVMATVIIGLSVCQRRKFHHGDIETGKAKQTGKPASTTNPCVISQDPSSSSHPETLTSLTCSHAPLRGDNSGSECNSRRSSEDDKIEVLENSSATEDSNH